MLLWIKVALCYGHRQLLCFHIKLPLGSHQEALTFVLATYAHNSSHQAIEPKYHVLLRGRNGDFGRGELIIASVVDGLETELFWSVCCCSAAGAVRSTVLSVSYIHRSMIYLDYYHT